MDNDWHDLIQKIKRKLENARQIFNVTSWNLRLLVKRFRFAAETASGMNVSAFITIECYPYQTWQMKYSIVYNLVDDFTAQPNSV